MKKNEAPKTAFFAIFLTVLSQMISAPAHATFCGKVALATQAPVDSQRLQTSHRLLTLFREQLDLVLVGSHELKEGMIAGMIAGSFLVEGPPGTGKTYPVVALTSLLNLEVQRVNYDASKLPEIIIGEEVMDPNSGEFKVRKGPIFSNVVIDDEINRATAMTLTALLQAQAEGIVSIGRETYKLPQPHIHMATQNSVTDLGVYPLTEANADRFTVKLVVDYPSTEETQARVQAKRQRGFLDPNEGVEKIVGSPEILGMRALTNAMPVAEVVWKYMGAISERLTPGVPGANGNIRAYFKQRASDSWLAVANAHALMRGAPQATLADVDWAYLMTHRHRIILRVDGPQRGVTPDGILESVRLEVAALSEFKH